LGCHTGEVKLLDLDSGKLVRSFKMHQAWVGLVLFSPDGTKVLSADSNVFNSPAARQRANKREMGLKLWRLDTGKVLHAFLQSDGWRSTSTRRRGSEVFSQDGKLMLLTLGKRKVAEQVGPPGRPSMQSRHVVIWELSSGKIVDEVPIGSRDVYGLGLSPDASKVWLMGNDGTLHLWDRARRKDGWSVKIVEGREKLGLALFSPDRKLLLTAPLAYYAPFGHPVEIVLKLWDTESGKLVRTLRGPALGPFPSR
jgi:WD40 repeat protein